MRDYLMGALALAVIIFMPISGWAAMPDDLTIEGVEYDASIPAPEDFLGHRIGDSPVRYHKLVEYYQMIGEMSDRVSVEIIGYTHERRPIMFAVVTSPENHARLSEIKAAQWARTEGGDASDDLPAVTWLNYGVHGVEESGMDAALPTLYHLASAQGAEIEHQLKNSVILLTAVFNPDGHSRRIAWRDQGWSYARNNNDQDRVKNFQFPGPRTNHYWFDLNRQWLPVTQPEPRAWMKKWHEWRPNLSVDYHEMGRQRSYYFAPGDPTRYYPSIPQEGRDLVEQYARFSSNFLDSEGWLYFNEEGYDNFYIGKGSTFPMLHGGVGILYEAAQGMGGEVVSDAGYLHTYRGNVRKHFRTSIASVEAAVEMRPALHAYQRAFYDGAREQARKADVKAYVFAAPEDATREQLFIDMLSYHKIRVHALARDITIDDIKFAGGDAYIVPLDQSQYTLASALFERVFEFENETFYDVSTWTMPLAFNLQDAPVSARAYRANLLGAQIDGPDFSSAAAPDEASYGYIFSWGPYYSPKALYRVLDAGIKARVMTRAATVDTTRGQVEAAPGTIYVHFEHQDLSRDEIYEVMSKVATEDGIEVHAVTSGWTVNGPQMGSDNVRPLTTPRPLIVVGNGVSSYDAGEIWHLLDYRMRVPVSMNDKFVLKNADLDRYTHIIFPGGGYGDLSDEVIEKISDWVRAGGVVIAERNASVWAQEKFLGRKADKKEDDANPARANYADKADMEAQEVIGGAIFGADLDTSHPLGFGYVRRGVAMHKSGTHTLERPKNPMAVVAEYHKEEPRLSGFAAEDKRRDIAGTPAVIAERKGRGAVVLFADNPNFRAYWYGTNKLFLNALFFAKAYDTPRLGEDAASEEDVE